MNTERTKQTFRAFQNPNFALFFGGQSVSLIGTWMQRTGVSWLVYTMTHSTFMLGLTLFASQFPSFLFSLYGGILSDRLDRHKILLFTQTISMIQALLLAILVLTHHHAVLQILVLSAILGVINAFDVPARQPLIHSLVNDKADLPNALALNSSMVNLARLIGPALSGMVLGKYGAGICFLLNAVSFLAVIISLLLMKLPAHVPSAVKKKMPQELSEGMDLSEKHAGHRTHFINAGDCQFAGAAIRYTLTRICQRSVSGRRQNVWISVQFHWRWRHCRYYIPCVA